jgi:hypothetical protein
VAKYRKIDPRIWNDQDFRPLSDSAKLVFLFLLTHPHLTAIGAMRGTAVGLASELGWSEKDFRKAFAELLRKPFLKVCETASYIGIPNFIKYNQPENPNVLKSWESALDYIPECDFKWQLIQDVKAFAEGLGKAFAEALPKAFAKGIRKPLPNHEQEQEQEQEQEKDLAQSTPVFELTATKGKYPVEQTQVDRWHELYPAVDVMQELRAMEGWLLANREKRKTLSGMPRFINHWLAKSQNGARPNPFAGRTAQSGNLNYEPEYVPRKD